MVKLCLMMLNLLMTWTNLSARLCAGFGFSKRSFHDSEAGLLRRSHEELAWKVRVLDKARTEAGGRARVSAACSQLIATSSIAIPRPVHVLCGPTSR